mmetsp:Transcript_24313/g.59750  ORF Transcript_24313/g.59750 Transcript_24313/m.59750 type:complete len:282 (-) Transcript_24313:211-1056(-)
MACRNVQISRLVSAPVLLTSRMRKKYASDAGWFLLLHANTKSKNGWKSISVSCCLRRRSMDAAMNGSDSVELTPLAAFAFASRTATAPLRLCSSYNRSTNASLSPWLLHWSEMRGSNVYRLNSLLDSVPFMSRSRFRYELYTRCADAKLNQFLASAGSSSRAACNSLKSARASPASKVEIRILPRRRGSLRNMNRRVAMRQYCLANPLLRDCSAAMVVTDRPTNASSSSSVSQPSASASWQPRLMRDCVSATCRTTNSMNVRPLMRPLASRSKRLNVLAVK